MGSLIVIVLFWTMFPLVYLILTSIKPAKILFATPPKFIFKPTFDIYTDLLFHQRYYYYFVNSLIITTITTIFALIIGSLAGFAFVELTFPFKKFLLFGILVTRMYPPITTLLPIFFILRNLGLIDTRVGLILVYTSWQLPLVVWVMRGFFDSIPSEIKESALLDGCSVPGSFLRIILPLSSAGLLAGGVLIFVFTWNEFLFALILTSINAKTAPVTIMSFIEVDASIQWGSVATLGVTTILPILIIAMFLHKFLVQGMMGGALKG